MAEIINGVPIGDLPGIESVPDDSMLVVEFLGKAYSMPGAVLRQMIQDVLDSMGDSVDDVTEARLTTAIETVLSSGKYSGVSPIVEVTKQEDETFVLHVVDAFGIKDYPIKVKVPDLSNGGNVMVELSGDPTNGYSVTMDGEAVTGDTLDKMAKEGSNIIGVVSSSLGFTLPNGFPNYVQEGTIFQYGNAVASRDPETFENPVGHKFEFHMRVNDVDYGLFYEEEQWKGVAVSAFLTLLLTEDDGAPYFSYNGQLLNSWYLSEILYMASITNRPVFCYQKDMRFYTEDGAAIIPQQYTAFTLTLTAAGDYVFSCEQDGYKYTLEVSGWGEYAPTAEKTIAYRTAESKADDLKAEDGTLFLLSAGEPIGAGVSIPTGDNNVFIGNYDTVTFSAIKIAHRTGKVCFLNNEGLMLPLLSLSDTEAIFVREINENTDYRVTITADGGKSFTMQDKNISDVYVSGLFSAKYADIKAAYEAGKACFVTYGALLCPLTVLDEEKAEFVGMLTPHIGMKGILYADGTYNFQYVHSNAVQTVEQTLTDDQKAQARTNIGAEKAGTAAQAIDNLRAVTYKVEQGLTNAEKYVARDNIGALSYEPHYLPAEKRNQALANISALSYETQSLTDDQKAQARANIGAAAVSSAGGAIGSSNAVSYEAQSLTEEQKSQARTNIDAEKKGAAAALKTVKYEAQSLTEEQKILARLNIGAVSNWRDLPHKPIFTETGDTLYWDGNTKGTVNAVFTADGMTRTMYKVSDHVLSVADLEQGYTLRNFYNGMRVHNYESFTDNTAVDGTIVLGIGDNAVVAQEKNAYNVPAGIYFPDYMRSLTVNGYNQFTREVLDSTYVPISEISDILKIVSYGAQSISLEARAQARTNIGAEEAGAAAQAIANLKAVTYKAVQGLTNTEKFLARENIGALSYEPHYLPAEKRNQALANISALSYETQTLTNDQKAQARTNIGALSTGDFVRTALPTPAESYRGQMLIVPTETEDLVYICLKKNGSYVWKRISETMFESVKAICGTVLCGHSISGGES